MTVIDSRTRPIKTRNNGERLMLPFTIEQLRESQRKFSENYRNFSWNESMRLFCGDKQ